MEHYSGCIACKNPFTDENVYSSAGWRETRISGMCEKCFDDCTLPDEGPEPDESDFEPFKYENNCE